jgi:hypothetical protein
MTKKQRAAADILRLLTDARRAWQVGDACASALRGFDIPATSIVKIVDRGRDGRSDKIVTMADGSACHISNVRRVR